MLEALKARHITPKKFFKDLKKEIADDNVSNGAAALAYYLTLSLFPAMIVMLAAVAFLPIPNLDQAVMDMLRDIMPGSASEMFTGVVTEVTTNKKGGLLSFGLLFTLWAASNGMYAIMQQLNITYDVKEGRNFFKTRGTALLLTLFFGVLVLGGLSLAIFGGQLQAWLASSVGWSPVLTTAFAVARWLIIAASLTLAFALIYYMGPDVEQKFRFISPGSVVGVIALLGASLLFKLYVANFGKYEATYGSIGAVIVLMLWLYVAGLALLLGSEVNALIEHYSSEGKQKGEKVEGRQAA